jgi:deazaflavin-dependent oxidoreductase (nitroreductase family)
MLTPFGNMFMSALIRSPLHPLLGESFAIITVTGRKSGRRISTPINVSRMDEGWMVVSLRTRTWWRNLLGGRAGELRHRGRSFPVAACILDQPEDVKNVLRPYLQSHPAYAKFFDIRLDEQGRIPDADLDRITRDRVIIRLFPM